MSQRIVVGLSGGVDSAVSAYLLKMQGHEVVGVFMKNWEDDDTDTYCSAAIDMSDAAQVCEKLSIPFHTINFAAEYWDRVFAYFLNEYQQGRTPNPDILCNKEIKFKAFLDYAKTLGADWIATGHYAGTKKNTQGETLLYKAKDLNKDQSYFLYALNQSQLQQVIFPLYEKLKPNVRKIAHELGLHNHAKKDSTGICFIGERKFNEFLKRYIDYKPGLIQSIAGETLGEHQGLMFYTIGQRSGLGIGGKKNASEEPWYVAKKDLNTNILYVVQGYDHPALYSQHLVCTKMNWITPLTTENFNCMAKIRYRQTDQQCEVSKSSEDKFIINFSEPQRAITAGQSIVFYQDEICLGGGIIIS